MLTRIVAKCIYPNKPLYYTITFRAFTPTPGGLEFQPGNDYYFISTSSSTDLYQRQGGRCSSHGMKVIFKVVDNSIAQNSNQVLINRKTKNKKNQTTQSFYSFGLIK